VRAVLAIVFTLVAGCKGMGGLGRGLGALGHAASGLGHVASGLGHVAAVSGRVLAPVARVAVHALPYVADAVVASRDIAVVVPDEEPEHPPAVGGPLLDDGDACGYCPDNLACGACGDVNGVACVLTPPGAYARCESQMKQP